MIRLSDVNDIESIIKLWHEAFGDTEEDIRFFIKRKYIPENTVVYDDNGKIASVLFLLDGAMHIKGKDYPSYYLYAACTAKSHRGMGIMAKMLEYSKNLAKSRGVKFICLKPGEKSLFDYYAKHGYSTVFYRKKLTLSPCDITASTLEADGNTQFYSASIRDNLYSDYNYFKWDSSAVEFAVDHNNYFGGNSILSRKGYALYTVISDEIYVKEFAFAPDFLNIFTADLFNKYDVSSVIFNLPINYPTDIGKFTVEPDSMIISTDSSPVDFDDGYLGLTLE